MTHSQDAAATEKKPRTPKATGPKAWVITKEDGTSEIVIATSVRVATTADLLADRTKAKAP